MLNCPISCGAHEQKRRRKTKKPDKSDVPASWNTGMLNFYPSLDCAHSNESIIYYAKKSAHLQVIPQQSTQNTANLPLQTYDKNHWTFFIVQHGRRL